MHKQLSVVAFLGILAVCPVRSAFAQLTVPTSAPVEASAAGAPAPVAPAAQVSNDAQVPITRTPCGSSVAAPFALPPPGSPPFVWILQPCFNSQGGSSTTENETYMEVRSGGDGSTLLLPAKDSLTPEEQKDLERYRRFFGGDKPAATKE